MTFLNRNPILGLCLLWLPCFVLLRDIDRWTHILFIRHLCMSSIQCHSHEAMIKYILLLFRYTPDQKHFLIFEIGRHIMQIELDVILDKIWTLIIDPRFVPTMCIMCPIEVSRADTFSQVPFIATLTTTTHTSIQLHWWHPHLTSTNQQSNRRSVCVRESPHMSYGS